MEDGSSVALGNGYGVYNYGETEYPYICIPESLYENVAHTAEGLLKTFSVDDYGHEKVLLARNNLYQNGNGEWAFEGPNWTSEGQVANSDSHKNLFSHYDLSSLDWPISVSGASWSWMNFSQWGSLLDGRGRMSEDGSAHLALSRYLKCKVGAKRNLLVFPDDYAWPSGVSSLNEAKVNQADLAWDDAPSFSVSQARALLDAGFVFLPAAIPAGEDNEYGGYWSSTQYYTGVFTEAKVGYQYEGTGSVQRSLRVAYPL